MGHLRTKSPAPRPSSPAGQSLGEAPGRRPSLGAGPVGAGSRCSRPAVSVASRYSAPSALTPGRAGPGRRERSCRPPLPPPARRTERHGDAGSKRGRSPAPRRDDPTAPLQRVPRGGRGGAGPNPAAAPHNARPGRRPGAGAAARRPGRGLGPRARFRRPRCAAHAAVNGRLGRRGRGPRSRGLSGTAGAGGGRSRLEPSGRAGAPTLGAEAQPPPPSSSSLSSSSRTAAARDTSRPSRGRGSRPPWPPR
jgi:hypothetical protein